MNSLGPIVHIVDDDESFLKALGRFMRAAGYKVETYNSPAEFLAKSGPTNAGCIIADLCMPGMDGLEFQEALVRNHQAIPIIFLTGMADVPSSVRAMRQGAEDFLLKTAPKDKLLEAVRRAIERDIRERGERNRLGELRSAFDALTPRECNVLEQVLTGKLNKQIAGEIGISERSVKRHRTSFMRKLGVQSVAELTRLVQESGLLVGGRFEPSSILNPSRS